MRLRAITFLSQGLSLESILLSVELPTTLLPRWEGGAETRHAYKVLRACLINVTRYYYIVDYYMLSASSSTFF